MKNRRRILFIALMTTLAVTIYAQQYDPESDFTATQQYDGKSVLVTKYIGSKKTVRIPQRIQGLPVTSIGTEAFGECTNITSVTIPNSVTRIDDSAFQGCIDLASVTFQGAIASRYFFRAFPGDLREKFYATNAGNETAGTYTRDPNFFEWTKQ